MVKRETGLDWRGKRATVCVADAAVSRRHSLIEKEEEQFVIADLESLNGTFVNDVPVKRRALQHGDRVRIGDSQFLFLMHDDDVSSTSAEVNFDDRQMTGGSTVQVRFNDALYLMARDLSALMKVSTTINAIRGVEELQKTLLELLFEVVPAQRGAILLSDGRSGDNEEPFATVFGLNRLHGPDETVKVSRTVAKQVLRDGSSFLISGPAGARDVSSESLSEARISSLLCVPLIMLDHTLGVIYLDTNEPTSISIRITCNSCQAIASITAVAVENARHFEWLESENQRLLADVNIEHNMVVRVLRCARSTSSFRKLRLQIRRC